MVDVEGVGAIEVEEGKRLVLAIEEDLGVDILHRCGGNARCTTCRVEYLEGEPKQATQAELEVLERKELLESGVRLSCQALVDHDVKVRPVATVSSTGAEGAGRAPDRHITPDPEMGYRFSTYATWWIRQAIQRGISDTGRTIRVPVHMGEKIRQHNRAREELSARLGREPTDPEIAERLGWSARQVAEAADPIPDAVSLDRPGLPDESSTSLGNLVADESAPEETEWGSAADGTRDPGGGYQAPPGTPPQGVRCPPRARRRGAGHSRRARRRARDLAG